MRQEIQTPACQARDDVAGTALEEYLDWHTFTLDTPQALSDSTLYWIHCSRSGAVDEDKFYSIDGNEGGGYNDGELKLWNGADWISWGTKTIDINFRVYGDEETTTQITTALTDSGEFIEGTDIEDTSGVNSAQYRDGDATLKYEVEELLKVGTTNNRRLLANVSDIRRVKIYEEPAAWSSDYFIDGYGNVTDENDTAILPADCPVGYWGRLKGVLPDTVDASRLSNPAHMFVEESEYDVRRGRYKILKTRDTESIFDWNIKDG